jgi:hypothetical protein
MTARIPFLGNPGMKTFPAGGTPKDYFNLLANDKFFEIILRETENNAERIFLENPSPRARITDWKQLSREEFSTWLGLLFHMGTIRLSRVTDYWKKSALFRLPIFSEKMSRDRFLGILQALHFAENPKENDPVPTDRIFKIRPLLNCFQEAMENIVSPSRELCIDESMVLWRGRLIFRQYVQGKRHKHGIKIYMLSEPSGLVLRLLVYTGSGDIEVGGRGHTESVVQKLLHGFKNLGHSLYMDNFYNSVGLTQDLLVNKTYCTGTLRANRKGNPQDVLSKKLKKGEVVTRYTDDGICVFKWKDKRDVTMISSEFDSKLVEIQTKRGPRIKPEAISKYNIFMRGVDHCDQLMSYYPCEHKSLRWYKKLALHIFQLMLTNTYILYNKYSGHKKTLYDFRLELIESLLSVDSRPVSRAPSRTIVSSHFPSHSKAGEKHKVQKRCRVCHEKGIRKAVTTICPDCDGEPGLCLRPCFQLFHDNL